MPYPTDDERLAVAREALGAEYVDEQGGYSALDGGERLLIDALVLAHRRVAELERERDEAQEKVARVAQWTYEHGAALCPRAGCADTFGDGMRAAKCEVGLMLHKEPTP